ncbi:MAG TPA: AEC family transporter [Acetobacteraceae bacterium]|nr:AEC family transporter [Acetobacteraceae bacterium]
MQNITLLILCLLIGVALRRFARVPENAHLALNGFIINVAFPALVLTQVHDLHLSRSLAFPVLMPWLLFATGAGAFWLLARYFQLSAPQTGALMLTGGLGNTSFMGLPMLEAFYGSREVATGILIDTLGTYLVLSTLGITVASVYSHGATDLRSVIRRVITFPPLIAVLAAAVLMNVQYPPLVTQVLARLGATLAPLALVSIGLQIRASAWRGNRAALAVGLGYKLLVAPAAIALLYVGLLQMSGTHVRATVLEAGMGPQIGAAIVASQYGLAPELVTLMVGVGTLLAFLTLPCWWALLSIA